MTHRKRLRDGGRQASVAIVLVVVAACGGDKDTVATATVARYCDLSSQLEQAAIATGAASAPGNFDGPAEAIGRLIGQVEPTIDELKASAPKEIRGDVTTTADALSKAKTGDLSGLRSPEFNEASSKVATFRSRSCKGGGSGSDG